MTATDWLVLAALCLTGAMSPGPSLLVVIRTTLHQGGAAGVLLALCHALGVGVYAAVVTFGLAATLLHSGNELGTVLFQLLRYAGVVFLLYLGWNAWTGSDSLQLGLASPRPDANRSAQTLSWRAARDGLLTALLNPKIALWFLALFSQFIDQSVGTNAKAGIVLLAVGVDALWYLLVVWLLLRALEFSRFQHLYNRVANVAGKLFALLLVGLAVRVLW